MRNFRKLDLSAKELSVANQNRLSQNSFRSLHCDSLFVVFRRYYVAGSASRMYVLNQPFSQVQMTLAWYSSRK